MNSYLGLTKPTRKEITLCALIAVAALALVLMYRGLGSWLVVSDPLPERIDVIFSFGGENVRDRYALELAQRYPDAVWILSTYNAAARVRTLDLEQIDARRLVVVDTLKNTWEEVTFLRKWLQQSGCGHRGTETQSGQGEVGRSVSTDSSVHSVSPWPTNIALVSGPYHMRRIKIATVRLLNHMPCRLFFTPAPMELYNHSPNEYRTWWKDATLNPLVKLEFVKTLYYLVRL